MWTKFKAGWKAMTVPSRIMWALVVASILASLYVTLR